MRSENIDLSMLIYAIIPAKILAKKCPTSVTNMDAAEFWNNPRTRLNHSRFRIEWQSKRKQYNLYCIKYWIEIP